MSQAYQPSGLTTRTGSAQTFDHSARRDLDAVPNSSGELLERDGDQGDQSSNDAQSRPITMGSAASTKFNNAEAYNSVYSRSPLTGNSGFGNSNVGGGGSVGGSSSVSISSFLSGKLTTNGSKLSSASVQLRFSKLIKLDRKKLHKQRELINDIQNWKNILVSEDAKAVLFEYSQVLEVEIETIEMLNKRREAIVGQLLNVSKREKRRSELLDKQEKTVKKLREHENKVGDSPITTLSREALEEISTTLLIVDQQFNNSITTGIKYSFDQYVTTLFEQSIKTSEFTEKIARETLEKEQALTDATGMSPKTSNSLISGPLNTANSASNLQKMAVHNNLKSYASSFTSHPPITPNEARKCFDNTFNDPSTPSTASISKVEKNKESSGITQDINGLEKPKLHLYYNKASNINLTRQEIEKLKLNDSSYPSLEPGPPSTASSNKAMNFSANNSESDVSSHIISHYSSNPVPGSLGIRPPSQNNDWAS